MIKLIATDIDGTLLDDNKELPPDFTEVVDMLCERGIAFAISSGRSYAALAAQFEDIADRICFICDNGANIFCNGKQVSCSVIPPETVNAVIDMCDENGLTALLCAENGTYYSSPDVNYADEVARYYNNTAFLPDLRKCNDRVYKLAIYSELGMEEHGYKALLRSFSDRLTISLSGFYWVDAMNPGINKGMGIRVLQNKIGASYEETMAFGDYLNDIEMLESAYYSFAMENSHPLTKKAANFSTGTNNDFSVTKEIKKILK